MDNKILIGSNVSNPLYTFNNAAIQTVSCVMSSSLSGDELAIDQFMPLVYSAAYIHVKFVPNGSNGLRTADGKYFCCYPGTGFLDKIPYGTPVWYYSDDELVGKFYTKRVVRSGKTWFDITAVSAVGILDGQLHYGGIYTGENFQSVAAEIIGNSFSFSCASDVSGIKIYGWIPIASRRENLHQLLFACGVVLTKNANGDMFFRYPDIGTVKNVPDNRIFLGGRVDYMTPATMAEVTEHIFMPLTSDETVTLYDNTQGGEVADHTLISFRDAPIHDLSASGTLAIIESGVNYAIVSGSGVLTGKKYTHITSVLRKETGDTGETKSVSVTDATLVNVANSENVVNRVLSYYASARTISCDLVVSGEKPGDQISFNNPYNDPEQAFLASMDINASSFLRASCEMITGYLPSGGGNNYSQTVILTGSGEWEVPVGVTHIRAAVCAGGFGGGGGHRGTAGGTTFFTYRESMDPSYLHGTLVGSDQVGKGGTPGTPGRGGRVLVISLNVTPGQKFSYSSGYGGVGGAGQTADTDAQDGQQGGDSTFGAYSSANGSYIDGGYLDIINNVLYCSKGDNGTSGDDGYLGARTKTEKGGGPLGGSPSSGKYEHRGSTDKWETGGGGQGGDAHGQRGGAGETKPDGTFTGAASGGVGATPTASQQSTIIGKGGTAGHGGGGGGTGGTVEYHLAGSWILVSVHSIGGDPGNGGPGGTGGPGGIIIYL